MATKTPAKQTPPTPALPVPQRKQMAAGGSPVGKGKKTPC